MRANDLFIENTVAAWTSPLLEAVWRSECFLHLRKYCSAARGFDSFNSICAAKAEQYCKVLLPFWMSTSWQCLLMVSGKLVIHFHCLVTKGEFLKKKFPTILAGKKWK